MAVSITTKRRALYVVIITAFIAIVISGCLVAFLHFNIWQVFLSVILYTVAIDVPIVVGIILFAKDKLQ